MSWGGEGRGIREEIPALNRLKTRQAKCNVVFWSGYWNKNFNGKNW